MHYNNIIGTLQYHWETTISLGQWYTTIILLGQWDTTIISLEQWDTTIISLGQWVTTILYINIYAYLVMRDICLVPHHGICIRWPDINA